MSSANVVRDDLHFTPIELRISIDSEQAAEALAGMLSSPIVELWLHTRGLGNVRVDAIKGMIEQGNLLPQSVSNRSKDFMAMVHDRVRSHGGR